jgi:hypothetical protein
MSLFCSLPAQPAFVGLGATLAVKIAQTIGFSGRDLEKIHREVDAAVQASVSRGQPANVDIEFETSGGRLTVRITHGDKPIEIVHALPGE